MSFRNEIKNKISDACILVNGAEAITGAGAENAAKRLDKRKKGVIFQIYAPFTDCISEINDNQEDNANNLDGVISIIV